MKRRKSWRGAVWSAAVILLIMLWTAGVMLWAQAEEPMPMGLFAGCLILPAVVAAGVLIALYQRRREIDGGEMDEAEQY